MNGEWTRDAYLYDDEDDDSRRFEDIGEECYTDDLDDYIDLDNSGEEGFTEEGDGVNCSICNGDEMWYDRSTGEWYCPNCGDRMTRAEFFNHIGAEPPGSKCLDECRENYPLCKRHCTTYWIDPNDPIL